MPNLNNLQRSGKTVTFLLNYVLNFMYPEEGGTKDPWNGICSEDGGG
jgi:hypothetical protein